MKSTDKFIEEIIEESTLDPRISDGLINLKNIEHIQVVAESLYDHGINEEIINEFVLNFMEEGKYPERQAYNKDGWLVTFPSKQYRDAAIKKRTHFTSDPTHGKGGMNLYYKKKGKQKRQTQQAPTAVGAEKKPEQSDVKTPKEKPTTPVVSKNADETSVTGKLTPSEKERLARVTGKSADASAEKTQPPATEPSVKEPSSNQSAKEPLQTAPTTPAIDVPVVTTPPEEYATVSKKFASQKGWKPTEYGEYRDGEGNPVAVVGLSGEVVPIRSNDREEYKIFSEKNMPS
jgi:hypothetical protein